MSTSKKRKQRQHQLTKKQVKEITRFLKNSDETSSFLSFVNHHLNFVSSEEYELNLDAQRNSYIKIKKMSELAKELAELLEPKPFGNVSKLTKENMEEYYLSMIILSLNIDQIPSNDHNLLREYLADLPGKLRHLSSLLDHYHGSLIELYVRKTKPKDFELRLFSESLIFLFQKTMGRIPTISEKSDDFEALLIIYQAFDYHGADSVMKEIQKACRKLRTALDKN